MSRIDIVLEGYNDSHITIHKWEPEVEIIAGLHILHGMAEHSLRYEAFAEYLNGFGIIVWAHDHRQHGQSVTHDVAGIFDAKDTWEAIVEDVAAVQREIYKEYSQLPMYMLGHSMGSLVLRSYLQTHQTDLSGAIIMGSPITPKLLAKAGVLSSKIIESLRPKQPSKFLDNLAVGPFIKTIDHPKTPFDWISQDEAVVKLYASDPLCGYVNSPLFYRELSNGSLVANEPSLMKGFPKINTLFISGSNDPCSQMGKGVRKLSETYRQLGVSNELVIMENMRHEVLNEVERQKTYDLLKDWLVEGIAR